MIRSKQTYSGKKYCFNNKSKPLICMLSPVYREILFTSIFKHDILVQGATTHMKLFENMYASNRCVKETSQSLTL